MREKQKSCLITSEKSEKMSFFLQNSFLALIMLISRKLVQGIGLGEKCCFFGTCMPAITKRVKIAYLGRDLDAQWFLKPQPKLGFVLNNRPFTVVPIYVVLNYDQACESRQLFLALVSPAEKRASAIPGWETISVSWWVSFFQPNIIELLFSRS